MEEVCVAGDLTKWSRLCYVSHLLEEPEDSPQKDFFIENVFCACLMFDLVELSKEEERGKNPNHPLLKWISWGLNDNYYSNFRVGFTCKNQTHSQLYIHYILSRSCDL